MCKLNPVTTAEDLEIIFSRFGPIVSCEVIKDKKTGESLQYAFIEFEKEEDCENAYFKMDNVLIDDRRIHVDFSQSVSKMMWDSRSMKAGVSKKQNLVLRNKISDGYEMLFDHDSEPVDSSKDKKKKKEKDEASHKNRKDRYTSKFSTSSKHADERSDEYGTYRHHKKMYESSRHRTKHNDCHRSTRSSSPEQAKGNVSKHSAKNKDNVKHYYKNESKYYRDQESHSEYKSKYTRQASPSYNYQKRNSRDSFCKNEEIGNLEYSPARKQERSRNRHKTHSSPERTQKYKLSSTDHSSICNAEVSKEWKNYYTKLWEDDKKKQKKRKSSHKAKKATYKKKKSVHQTAVSSTSESSSTSSSSDSSSCTDSSSSSSDHNSNYKKISKKGSQSLNYKRKSVKT